MGVLTLGKCFDSAAQAAQAQCSAYPQSGVVDGVLVTWSCVRAADDGSSLSLVRQDTSGASASVAMPLVFAPCDELAQYNDSLSIWGLGLTACAVVYCIKVFVYRLVTNQ